MKTRLAAAAAVSLFCLTIDGQIPPGKTLRSIPSLAEPHESLTINGVSTRTGLVTFASASGRGVLLPLDATTPAERRATAFVEAYGEPFGLTSSSQVRLFRAPETDELGVERVHFQQMHMGVPVRAGELVVHLRGSRVVVANGHILDDFPENVSPSVEPSAAVAGARKVIEKHLAERAANAEYSDPRLEIFSRALLSDVVDHRSRLAWFVEVTGPSLREYVWIDAHSGVLLLAFSQLTVAKSREVYNGNHLAALPGTLVRSEGGPATGDTDQDSAYTYAGAAYDYFLNNHSRDSYDNAGATIRSVAHHCAADYPQGSCPTYQNAAWTGQYLKYADGWTKDDIVAHELTHAVTERTAGLLYYMQSGALNESFSDIFGETVDLTDGMGNDSSGVRWQVGEDLANGAIRNMMNPGGWPFDDPGKMSDANFKCYSSAWTDPYADRGGVHSNSGIPNHAYALMVDGGTYNDTAITGIGLTKAAKIQYRALTTYLTSGATFTDNYNALIQSCTDLVGTAGITTADCNQVTKAIQAVEMNHVWNCPDAVRAPPMCPTGTNVNTFADSFEVVTSNWGITNDYGIWNPVSTTFAKGGTRMAYGTDPEDVSDHRMTMLPNIVLPTAARLYFDQAFEFENGLFYYDGGVLEYSTNNGSTWADAGSLIDAGFGYNGTIANLFTNPMSGRAAFVASSSGYTGTRLNLSSLAGQSVRFRFRIGSDYSVASLGWVVDNFTIYTCSAISTGTFPVVDSISRLGTVNVATESSSVIGNAGRVLTDLAYTSSGTLFGISFDNLYTINSATGSTTLIGPLGYSGMNALVGYGNTLIAASNDYTSLFTVNPNTGAAAPLSGSLGYASMGDLAFHSGALYAAVMNGGFSDLVRVTLSGNSFTATNLGHVTNDNELFGLAEGTDHNLYGFAGRSVIRINTSNPAMSAIVVPEYSGSLDVALGANSNVVPFANDPLIGGNPIRAGHITELRNRIAAVRVARGLPAFTWTEPALAAGTSLKWIHVVDLRNALSQAYTAVGTTSPVFTDPTLTGLTMKALHVMELRAAVMAIE